MHKNVQSARESLLSKCWLYIFIYGACAISDSLAAWQRNTLQSNGLELSMSYEVCARKLARYALLVRELDKVIQTITP